MVEKTTRMKHILFTLKGCPIHTWPEKGMAVCDIFTCGSNATPEVGVEYMKEQLKATDISSHKFVRPLE